MDVEEGFFAVMGPEEANPGADENFFAEEPVELVKSRRVGHVGRPRAPPTAGAWGAWVIQTKPVPIQTYQPS